MSRIRMMTTTLACLGTLVACGPQQPAKQEAPSAPATTAVAAPPPVPAEFDPCNTMTFEQVQAVIGTRPTITANDRTGSVSEGWATCTYDRADHSAGPTLTVRIAKFPSGPQATRRQREIVGGMAQATAVPGDADHAFIWTEGDTVYLQYASGWWLTRRTLEGAVDADARARLIAAPHWP